MKAQKAGPLLSVWNEMSAVKHSPRSLRGCTDSWRRWDSSGASCWCTPRYRCLCGPAYRLCPQTASLEYERRGEAIEHMGALFTRVCSSVQTLQSEGEHSNKKVSVTSLWGYCTDNIAAVIFVKGPQLQSKTLQKFRNIKRDSIKKVMLPGFTGGGHWPCSKRS